jgi:hypothetical protein
MPRVSLTAVLQNRRVFLPDPIFQMQLLEIEFIIKTFYQGFMQVLILQSLKSQYLKSIKH